jgi:ABC-type Zn uptake system ZnuABC Zn-binding protein ZnuA
MERIKAVKLPAKTIAKRTQEKRNNLNLIDALPEDEGFFATFFSLPENNIQILK